MASYKAEKDLFVDNRHIKAGQIFSSETPPGKHWGPVDRRDEAAKAERLRRATESVADLAGAIPEAQPGSAKPHFNKQDIEIPTASKADLDAAEKNAKSLNVVENNTTKKKG
jgi:hypothetical protein